MGRVSYPQLTGVPSGVIHSACHQVKLNRSPFRLIVIARGAVV
jgi:hypothetical protein